MGWEWKPGDLAEVQDSGAFNNPRWVDAHVIDADIRGLPDHVVIKTRIGGLWHVDIVESALLFPRGHNRRVHVEGVRHTIEPSAVEERCMACGGQGAHKVGDQSGPANFHELTAYLCCEDMRKIGMNCDLYPEY